MRLAERYAAAHAATRDAEPQYSYSTKWFEQRLDHFGFVQRDTFQQRYLVSTDSWGGPGSPIFFYTGNEGPIPLFAANTGLVWESAPEFKAAVVFAEHRYYGETLPFGNYTYNNTNNLEWLTSEQALADYSVLVTALKDPASPHYLGRGAETSPVVAFGGSYGGMLTAWARIKYPHVFAGGVAASAPIWQFESLTSSEAFSAIATRTFTTSGGAECSGGVSLTWNEMERMAAQGPAGLHALSAKFGLCADLASADEMREYLFPWITGALTYMAMADYPYPSSFLGPMPASPVRVACTYFRGVNGSAPAAVDALVRTVNLFYNFTGEGGSCFNVKQNEPSTLADAGGWNYQACTEMTLNTAQNGVDDMFYPLPYNLTAVAEACAASYNGVVPRPEWVTTHYGGHNINESTNIVFSQGSLDPWSGGGVLRNISDTLVAVYIEGGAHHLDLRASNPADPQSVKDARAVEKMWIARWVKQWLGQQ